MLEGIGLRLLGFVLDWFADRTNARMRLGSGTRFLIGTLGPGGSASWIHEAELHVYNAGRRRFTVNEAGWRGKDGERLEAYPTSPMTIEPGGPEQTYTAGASGVLEFRDAHGGITHAYVHLAGDAKPKDRRIRKEWLAEVEEVARKPTTTYW